MTPFSRELFEKQIGIAKQELLERLAFVGKQHGAELFVVGGSVRDLLLGVPLKDLDLMFDTSLSEICKTLEREWELLFPGEERPRAITRFSKYFTGKIQFAAPFRGQLVIDLSQARTEFYASPGAKPNVRAGTLEEDVHRRDFTVNALFVRVSDRQLVDLSGGVRDLEAKLLRVHHSESFSDDPIRLFRAVRFALRFQFSLEEETGRLFRSVGSEIIEAVPEKRRFDELLKILGEANRSAILVRLEELSLLRFLCPFLLLNRLGSVQESDTAGAVLNQLLDRAERSKVESFLDRVQLSAGERKQIVWS